jgi:hypothetical protein
MLLEIPGKDYGTIEAALGSDERRDTHALAE